MKKIIITSFVTCMICMSFIYYKMNYPKVVHQSRKYPQQLSCPYLETRPKS